MKRLVYGALFLATVGIGCVGCKKESPFKNKQIDKGITYRLDNIPEINFEGDIESLLKDANDNDGEKLNNYLFKLAVATKESIKSSLFNKELIEIAKSSNTGTVYFSEIKEKLPQFYLQINNNLEKEGLSIEQITSDMTHKPIRPNPKYPETEKIEVYQPAIYIPNYKLANPSLNPLISPNIVVSRNKEDCILSWFYNEDGSQKETIVNERTAMNTTNPIFILDHAIPIEKMKKIGEFNAKMKNNQPSENSKSYSYFNTTQIQIKYGYAYEQGLAQPRSEFTITGVWIPKYNSVRYIYPNYDPYQGYNADNSNTLEKIHKNSVDASSLINITTYFSNSYTPYSNNRVFWNTFERDWNRTTKQLGSGFTFGKSWLLEGNARYNGDWYQWIPNTTDDHYVHYEWFGWETEVKFESWKSSITIEPVN